jgi:hypothetical protein
LKGKGIMKKQRTNKKEIEIEAKNKSVFNILTRMPNRRKVYQKHDTDSKFKLLHFDRNCIETTGPEQPPEFNLKVNLRKYKNGCMPAELKLAGAIFVHDADLLSDYCANLVREKNREITVDFRELNYICREGARKLADTITVLERAGTVIKFHGMRGEISKYLADIGEYTLLNPAYHEDSWHRLEYQHGFEYTAMRALEGGGLNPVLALTS